MNHLKKKLISGLLILVPVIMTYVVLSWFFYKVDGLLQPVVSKSIGRDMPGLGFLVLLIIIYVTGMLGENFIGKRIINLMGAGILKAPVVGTIYSSAKQLIESFSGGENSSFKHVVLIEYPRKGVWTVGFLTGTTVDENENALSIVYIPTAPTPNSGWVAIIPSGEIYYTDLSVSNAMRLVLSGGIMSPDKIGQGDGPNAKRETNN